MPVEDSPSVRLDGHYLRLLGTRLDDSLRVLFGCCCLAKRNFVLDASNQDKEIE
jgi:hypothetical protein